MLLTNLSLDILLYISTNLSVHPLSNLLLHCKDAYSNRHAFLKNNPYLHKYSQFDNTTSVYHVIFYSDTLPDIKRHYNRKELYAITNIVSYHVVNNVITRDIAELYLLAIYARATLDTIQLNFKKNTRLKLCLNIFKPIFQYDWEYLNINLYDLFSIIHCIVYKKYNDLYGILYHLQCHKSLTPLKTLHILLHYKESVDTGDDLLCFAIIYILYQYILYIQYYIKGGELGKLIPVILAKCGEIKSGLYVNNKLPNNLKIMFLKKIDSTYDTFYTTSSYS
jgi:hypothetical protein